jgi:tetratricopeptide (TPR) repeat protein
MYQPFPKSFITFTIIVLLFFTANVSHAQNIRQWIAEADSLEQVPNETASLHKLLMVLQYEPKNVYALSKSSELYSRIGKRMADRKTSIRYYQNALELAERALAVNDRDDGARVSMAMALGRIGMTQSGKEKVKAAKDIKTHVEIALQVNPSNFKAWHILGKWHYEVSNLNMFEKAALKLLFGGMPPSSLTEAIRAYKKAQEFAPLFMLNYLELAKAQHRNGEKREALQHLQTVIGMKEYTEDDVLVKREAKDLLKTWK